MTDIIAPLRRALIGITCELLRAQMAWQDSWEPSTPEKAAVDHQISAAKD